MTNIKERIITVLTIAGFILCCIASRSCANTTTPPSGGPKDTIPPVLLKLTPDNYTTMFPRVDGTLALLYDEYTVVKTSSDIVVSPPSRRRPTSKIKGKNIIITFQDTLLENQTYTIDFNQALADNNEGNLAPRFVYTFSTGETIDSMYITGTIADCKTLQPVSKAIVTLYSDLSDSACFNKVPDAVAKPDAWGFFTFRNIKPTQYRLYAYTDADNDYKYNPDGDQVAFLDSVITPTEVVRDSIFELMPIDLKDTLACKARSSMYSMLLFSELQSIQYLQNSGRRSEKMGYLKFSAGDVQINSMEFFGIDSSDVLIQYNATRDSLDFWITSKYKMEDSLLLKLNYMKSDSTGKLVECIENLSLAVDKPDIDPSLSMPGAKKEKKQTPPDTVFTLKITSTSETVEQEGIKIVSEHPVLTMNLDSLHLKEINPKNQETEKSVIFKRDSTDIRNFIIIPDTKLQKGYNYELRIPQGTFVNMYDLPNKEEIVKFAIPNSEELCSLTLALTGVNTRYIVELTDDKLSSVLRKYNVEADGSLFFPYLKAGKYSIRITQDNNRNGIFDTGNLLAHRQPELVKIYSVGPDNTVIEIPESADIEQSINLEEMFR